MKKIDFLMEKYKDVDIEIKHFENLIAEYLNFFFIVPLAFSTALLMIFGNICTENTEHLENSTNSIKVLDIFCLSNEQIILIIHASFGVIIISYALLLIITKLSLVKFDQQRQKKEVIKELNEYPNYPKHISKSSHFEIEKAESYWTPPMILSVRNISNYIPFFYIVFCFSFQVYLINKQYDYCLKHEIKCFNSSINNEGILLLIELLLIGLYACYSFSYVWGKEIKPFMQKQK